MIIVGEKSSGGKLSACLRARGFENKKWECHAAKKILAKILPEQAAITQESPYKEELAVLRESDSLHRASTMVRRSMKVGKEDRWSELWKSSEFNSWTRAKLQECYHEVRQDDDQRKTIAQQIMWKSTNILRRKIVPVQGQGVVSLSYVCPHLYRFPIEDYIWWVSTGHAKNSAIGGARLAAASTTGKIRTESWSYRTPRTPQCFGLTFRCTVRATISCALSSFWANQQMGRDSLVDVLVEGLQEQNRLKIMDEVKEVHRGGQSRGGEDRRLGEELGGDQSGRARLQQRRFPQAAVREAVDELHTSKRRRRHAAHFHRHNQCGRQLMETTDGGRGLACHLSNHLQRPSRERNGRSRIVRSWK